MRRSKGVMVVVSPVAQKETCVEWLWPTRFSRLGDMQVPVLEAARGTSGRLLQAADGENRGGEQRCKVDWQRTMTVRETSSSDLLRAAILYSH